MPDQEAGASERMSIASLISRFTAPCLFTSGIPTYRHSFSPPLRGDATLDDEVKQEEASSKSKASYVEWSQILPVPSSMLSSFSTLFRGPSAPTGNATAPRRLTFFGEQHHQPQVMRAQLQTLHALHEQCQQASASEKHKPIYQLHLVLEHFSVLDQDMLSSFSDGTLSTQQLADRYTSESEEGFQIGRYMPLLMLAKELQVPVWGGFPPRSWAKQVFREGIESVKTNERHRIEQCASQERAHLPRCSPLFTSWHSVTRMSAAHRSYLSSLMRPDMPPRFPQLPETDTGSPSKKEPAQSSAIYPTWLLQPNLVEKKGFGPAQALKDSYLAHVTAWLLRGAPTATTLPESDSPSSKSERPVINVVLVMCGLGHCEYGFGAPERVVDILEAEHSAPAKPYIIASKPLDAGLWLGYEHSLNAQPTLARDEDETQQPQTEILYRWRNNPWERKLADAVLLYDWMDEEGGNRDSEAKPEADTTDQQ